MHAPSPAIGSGSLGLALVLAACGGGEASGSSESTDTATTSETATGPNSSDAAFARSVDHAMGETEIPAAERVVTLDTGELDSAIALGRTPVGAVSAPVEDGLLGYLAEGAADTELVGTIDEPDLEAIAALQPDLILSSKLRHEGVYDELSGIAPTVFTETVGVAWKDKLRVHAEALGGEDQADELLADYEDRPAKLGQRLAVDGQCPTVSVVRFVPGETRLYQKDSFINTILDDVGLARPASQDVDDFALEISEEQLPKADADVIFTSAYGPEDETTRSRLVESRLWDSLEAVQAGRVHEVADDRWMLGIGIGAAQLVLDGLEQSLLDEEG